MYSKEAQNSVKNTFVYGRDCAFKIVEHSMKLKSMSDSYLDTKSYRLDCYFRTLKEWKRFRILSKSCLNMSPN